MKKLKKFLMIALSVMLMATPVTMPQKVKAADDLSVILTPTQKTYKKTLNYIASKYYITGVTGDASKHTTDGNKITVDGTYYKVVIETNSAGDGSNLTITYKASKGGGDNFYIYKKSNDELLRTVNVCIFDDTSSITPTFDGSTNNAAIWVWEGYSISVSGTSAPANAYDKFNWSIANSNFARISATSNCSSVTVTGVAEGTTTLYINSVYGKAYSKTVTVYVRKRPTVTLQSTASVSLNGSVNVTASMGNTTTNTVLSTPSWTVQDSNIASISASGYTCKITGKSKGTTTLTYAIKDMVAYYRPALASALVKKVTITVSDTNSVIINSTEYGVLNDQTINVEEGDVITFSPTLLTAVSGATFSTSVSNNAVVSLSGGKITIVSGGEATITCTSSIGVSAKFYIKALAKVKSVSITEESLTMFTGDSYKLNYNYSPTQNVNTKSITFTSSNEAVVKVSSTGELTPIGAGTATITMSAPDWNNVKVQDTVEVKVVQAIQTAYFSCGEKMTVPVGSIRTVGLTIKPAGATAITRVASSNNLVCQVATNGQIKAIAPGTATISAKVECLSGKIYEMKTVVTVTCPAPTISVKKTVKKATVKWNTISSASKYVVYRKKGNGKYKVLATVTTTKYVDKKIKVGKTYSYKVVAVSNKGTAYSSVDSNVKKVTIIPKTPKIKTVKKTYGLYTVLIKGTKYSGYDICVGKTKKAKKVVATTTSKAATIDLSKGKNYIRIRAYKMVNGKKVYSKYSKAKKVVVK